ncbi:glycoside hydrolase family 78 protein [Sclerotinia borealis F-4128]|uniref:Glycoside hydrolase family 78 protein n=1 Tax=Sclerotinia borealis (strain F-4128) TaxID=1432307 RepID=W9CF03_SCLBF|nr:glycoside hydrolase family 78 protein [Sclerotinia borealis F-4128]
MSPIPRRSPPNDPGSLLGFHFPLKIWKEIGGRELQLARDQPLILSTQGDGIQEIILDYGRCVGGLPFIETLKVTSNGRPAVVDVVYSETSAGVHNRRKGDGPFFGLSNAMDTYRAKTLYFVPSKTPKLMEFKLPQTSQRYQKLTLVTPNCSVAIASIGFRQLRARTLGESRFVSSSELLNNIWRDGVNTIDRCTVEAGEVQEVWKVAEFGTRIPGQRWAPCRHGTHWKDKAIKFKVKIESGGASWGVHMVESGLIFLIDIASRRLLAFEGTANTPPAISKGTWDLPGSLDLFDWLRIDTEARGSSVLVKINNRKVALVKRLSIYSSPGAEPNTGSVAFGGPEHYLAIYRSLVVRDVDDKILYENDMRLKNKVRVLSDFQVGTNQIPCTVDSAKGHRICSAGDLLVMCRSIYHSTGHLEAVLGSISLLSSHQGTDGYLGNISPIQKIFFENERSEPPTYAFFSLTFSFQLLVVVKDYWMYTGDFSIVERIWDKLESSLNFARLFEDKRGLIVAPPSMSRDFMSSDILVGASSKLNLAYYDALISMSKMCCMFGVEDQYTSRANALKEQILENFWHQETGVLRLSDRTPPSTISHEVNAYGRILGIVPQRESSDELLGISKGGELPRVIRDSEGGKGVQVVSPYTCGMAVEALFQAEKGHDAVKLVERVWGPMADPEMSEYSGGHWKEMKPNGQPTSSRTSMMQARSTWPVSILPKYLAGVEPLSPGWSRWKVHPVLAGLSFVDYRLSTSKGEISVAIHIHEASSTGELTVYVPKGTVAELYPPEGWIFLASRSVCAEYLEKKVVIGQDEEVTLRLCVSPQDRQDRQSASIRHNVRQLPWEDYEPETQEEQPKTPSCIKRLGRKVFRLHRE